MKDSGPKPSRAPVAIVGTGNRLISCDNIGPKVLHMSRTRFGPGTDLPDVDLIDAGSTGLVLMDHIANQELMILVDACCGEGPGGRIHILEPDLTSPAAPVAGSHQIGALEALMAARYLYPEKMPRRLWLILVETDGLTRAEMEKACGRMVRIIEGKIEEWQQLKS